MFEINLLTSHDKNAEPIENFQHEKVNKFIRWMKRKYKIKCYLYSTKNNTAGYAYSSSERNIEIFFNKKDSFDQVLSVCIHEFGHIYLWNILEKNIHSEKQAWEEGLKNVPEKYIPENINKFINLYLKTYGYKRKYLWNQKKHKLIGKKQ